MKRRLQSAAAVAMAGLLLSSSGCALLDKSARPTPNLSATRVSAGAPGRSTTARPSATPSASASGSATPGRSATPTPATPVDGTVSTLSAAGYGAVRLGQPATASADARWDPACQAWRLTSSGGSTVGEATTLDGTQTTAVFAVRVEHPSVTGPGGIHVGSSAGEVRSALPGASTEDTTSARWVHAPLPGTQLVAQVDRTTESVTALLLQPADKTAKDFPPRAQCR